MPSATFNKPVEEVIEGKCKYSYYSVANNEYSEKIKSRICHIVLPGTSKDNADIILLIFTIRNQNGKWKIHSEGDKRMDQGAMIPTRNAALKEAKKNHWKFIAIATVGENASKNDIVNDYFISIESYSYGSSTVYELTNELSNIENMGRPDFYRTYVEIDKNIYPLLFIKRSKLLEYLYIFDDRPYGNIKSVEQQLMWHNDKPTLEDYKKFKQLIKFFVLQLRINNNWIREGEKKFVDRGKPDSARFIEKWRHYNGFDVLCRFGRGDNARQSGANFIYYECVNISPCFNQSNTDVEAVCIKTNPYKKLMYKGAEYTINSLDLDNENEPNANLIALFEDFRNEVFKWQKGEYLDIKKNLVINYEVEYTWKYLHNRIVFGAPGTGKSFMLERERKGLLFGDESVDENTLNLSEYGSYERVTFHPNYSYSNFVGTYKPVSFIDDEGNDVITYKFIPGPFMRLYAKCLESANSDDAKPYLLIIEEINRANVASVFGDIFQLLDRNESGVSVYPIQASEDIKNYLSERLNRNPEEFSTIRIPNNMFIWATMNSADQGVFPMDTAFKRRWEFTYIGIDDKELELGNKTVLLGSGEFKMKVEWNKLRKAINKTLSRLNINEDKQLGPFFISKKIVVPKDDMIESRSFINMFKSKVIMYLFEDAARQKREIIFGGCMGNKNRYSEICQEFETRGVLVFCKEIIEDTEVEYDRSKIVGDGEKKE